MVRITGIFMVMCLCLWACRRAEQESVPKQIIIRTPEEPASDSAQHPGLPKARIALAYSTAIKAYLNAVYKNGKSDGPDTLYIGKNPEFPDIELPAVIGHSGIRIIEPDAINRLNNQENTIFLNMISWFVKDHVEFMIVTFRQGAHPQFNCSMYLTYKAASQSFALDSLRFKYPYLGAGMSGAE